MLFQYKGFWFVVVGAFFCPLAILYGTDKACAAQGKEAESRADNTPLKIITAESWKRFKAALGETYLVNGYLLTRWSYAGCDAEYHYAARLPRTIMRLKKGMAPRDELVKLVEKQQQRAGDLTTLRDPDLQRADDGHSFALNRWRKQSRLDTSLYDEAERAYRAAQSKALSPVDLPVRFTTAASWGQFKVALEETYMECGYSFTKWAYLGCDAEYHYAAERPCYVMRLKKGLAPPDELFKVVKNQWQRALDFDALGDLDLPWADVRPSDAYYRWLEESHLDRSLDAQAERACRAPAKAAGSNKKQ